MNIKIVKNDKTNKSLFKKMFRNSSYNVFAMIINLITFALLTPFLVKGLGVELYGIYLTISAITGFMSIMDLGIAGASVRQFSHYFTLKEYRKFNQVYTISLLIYTVLGLVIFMLILLITNSNIISILFGSQSAQYYSEIGIALFISAFTVFLNMVLLVNSNISMALQQNNFYALGKIIITISQAILTIAMVLLNFGLIGVVIAKLISVLIGIISYTVINKRIISSIKMVFEFDYLLFKDLISFGLYNSVTQISNGVIAQLDRVLISMFLGPEYVSYYAIPMTAAQRIHSLVSTAANVIFPVTSELKANKKIELLINLYKKSQNIILFISSILILPFLLFSEEVLSIWIGQDFALESKEIFTIILFSYIIIGSNIPSYFMFNGLNLPKYNAYYSLLTAIIKVISTVVLINSIGIIGAGISLLISTITVPLFIYIFEKKINSNRFHFLFKGYIPIGVCILIIYYLEKMIIGSTIGNIFLLICVALIFLTGYVSLLYFIRFFQMNNITIRSLIKK